MTPRRYTPDNACGCPDSDHNMIVTPTGEWAKWSEVVSYIKAVYEVEKQHAFSRTDYDMCTCTVCLLVRSKRREVT